MIGKITDKNPYLILPGKVSRLERMYAEDFGVSITEVPKRIYKSTTYRELEKD